MGDRPSLIDRVRQRAMRRYWTRKLNASNSSPELQKDARKLRRILERFDQGVIAREMGPVPDPFEGLPQSTLWASRPEPWSSPILNINQTFVESASRISPDTSVYHDDDEAEVSVHQTIGGLAPFTLSLDLLSFRGDYLSLALGFPKEQVAEVQPSDVLRLDAVFTTEHPITAIARANVKVGPNIERVTRTIDQGRAKPIVEFDLFYEDLEAQKISDVWIDIIFEKPSVNLITMQDVRVSRRPRINL